MPTSQNIDRRIAGAELDNLLEALTIPQLLDIAAAVGKSSRVDHNKQKEALITQLKTIIDFDTLCLSAHRIETLSPFKHAFVFSFANGTKTPQKFSAALQHAAAHTDKYTPIDLKNDELIIQTVVPDQSTRRLNIKLAHAVTSAEWAKVSPTERKLQKTRERHPIVVILRFDSGLASITFPGFTQGAAIGTEERVTYEQIAQNVVTLIKERFDAELVGLPVRPALEALLNAPASEVIDRGRTIRESKGGSLTVNCHGSKDDTSALLANLLKQQINPAEVRSALRDATADVVWLYWSHLKVDTKLTLTDFAPELLFLWRRGGASTTHLEYVLQRLAPHLAEAPQRLQQARDYLLTMRIGEILRVSDLMQKFGLTGDESLSILTPLVRVGELVMRFRVRTNRALLDYENTWTTSLDRLPISVTDDEDHEINLMESGNIEVGYERLN
jgi:hypothetical protein